MSFNASQWEAGNRKYTLALMARTRDFVRRYNKDRLYWEGRKCPVCENENAEVELQSNLLQFFRCTKCRLLFQSPVLKDHVFQNDEYGFSKIFKAYWDMVIRHTPNRYKKPYPGKAPILCDIWPLKRGGNLLDVGCSTGKFLSQAAFFYNAEGLEINPDTRDIAAKRGLYVHNCFLSELARIRSNYYDVITFNQLLYCIRRPKEEFISAYKLLKKDGVLYINTPNADSIAMSYYKEEHCHVAGAQNMNIFSPDTFYYIAKDLGFRIIAMEKEFVDIYITDLIIHKFFLENFVHRNNCFVPFYARLCKLEDTLHKYFLNRVFHDRGDYIRVIMQKS